MPSKSKERKSPFVLYNRDLYVEKPKYIYITFHKSTFCDKGAFFLQQCNVPVILLNGSIPPSSLY
ncbi:Exostosin domain-containing protein [Bacillus sp. IT-79MI2]